MKKPYKIYNFEVVKNISITTFFLTFSLPVYLQTLSFDSAYFLFLLRSIFISLQYLYIYVIYYIISSD